MPFMYYGYGFVLIGFLIALLAQWNVKSTYSKYKKIHNSRGITGAMAARQILDQNGLYHVRIESVSGEPEGLVQKPNAEYKFSAHQSRFPRMAISRSRFSSAVARAAT